MLSKTIKTRHSIKKLIVLYILTSLSVTGLILILIAALFVLNNNISLRPLPKAEFYRQMDIALALSTQWLESKAYALAVTEPNTALLHMIDDMANMSQNPHLRQITESFLQSYPRTLWRRLVDEKADFQKPHRSEVTQYQD